MKLLVSGYTVNKDEVVKTRDFPSSIHNKRESLKEKIITVFEL